MVAFIIYYLLYNIIIGITLSIIYRRERQYLKDEPGYYALTFFPVTGLGKWRYEQAAKATGSTDLPKAWYIWRYVCIMHLGFLVAFIIFCIAEPFIFPAEAYVLPKNPYHSDNQNGEIIGMFIFAGAEILKGIFGLIVAVIVFFMSIANRIERNTYRNMGVNGKIEREEDNDPGFR